ncbi:MAG: acyl-ACP thioesterase [Fibrobacter sp.]|nr:acyl-ACP thioesterase [Fibrobacter sp.]
MIDIYSLSKNPLVFQKPRSITSAYIDVSGKMGVPQTVLMIQDNFTENFGAIKMDNFCVREKGGYWVISRAKFKFFRRPFWRDKVITTSFPTENALIRTYENTAITTVEGEPIILGVQEACCLDLQKHRPMKLSSVDFPNENLPSPLLDNHFTKFEVSEDEYVYVYEQRVLPQHLDMSHHMNNIEYVKLSMNVFSSSDLELCLPSMLEVHFLGESLEGQMLKVYRADKKGATYMKIEDEAKRQVFEMKIKMK